MLTAIVYKGHGLTLKRNWLMFSMRPHPLHAYGNCLQGARANIKEEQAHVLDEAAPLTCSRELSIRGTG
jgi:hypothetical protein